MKRKILPLFVMFWVLGHIQFMAQPPKAFFPIFHELHDKQRGINWQIRELKKRSLPAHSTDKDYYNLIKEINKLKIESAELEDVYYKKMCKAVPARKVHEAMQAEDRFHRRMLRKFSNRPDRSKQK